MWLWNFDKTYPLWFWNAILLPEKISIYISCFHCSVTSLHYISHDASTASVCCLWHSPAFADSWMMTPARKHVFKQSYIFLHSILVEILSFTSFPGLCDFEKEARVMVLTCHCALIMLCSTGEILPPAADRQGSRGTVSNPQWIAHIRNRVQVVCPPASYAGISDLKVKGCNCDTTGPRNFSSD